MSRFTAALCALLCALAGMSTADTASAYAEGGPSIGDTRVERAPIGQKGGLMNPVVWCPSGAEPAVRTIVEGLDNNFRAVWRYRGSLPGLYFPRVAVGRYELSTEARCGTRSAQRVEVVRVHEKTARTTMSWKEFRQIRRGMTPTRVSRIVGYSGRGGRYGNQMWRTFDLMAFWQYGSVEFRNGRVVRKDWKFDHD